MEMFELNVITHFAAAHQLKMVDEKCENLHGHNWKIEVTVRGPELNNAGILLDFKELKEKLSPIIKKLDHQFLNNLAEFGDDAPPSSEQIARYIAVSLQTALSDSHPAVHVARVTAWESENASATYIAG